MEGRSRVLQSALRPVEGDVAQVVEVTEDADVTKAAHTSKQCKAQMGITGLQHRVHRFEDGAEAVLEFHIFHRLQQRFVVLVHQDDHILKRVDEVGETVRQMFHRGCDAVLFFPVAYVPVEHTPQTFLRSVVASVEIKMQHGVLFPLLLQLHDGKTVEQVFLTFEVRFQRGEQQALAESARTRQEEIAAAAMSKVIYKLRLINVNVVVSAQLLKTLYAYG